MRLGISVEGQTELRFVRDMIGPHLERFGVFANPVPVATSRSADGTKARGGGIDVDRVVSEIGLLLRGCSDDYVTTLYDFYGLEGKRPGDTVEQLKDRIAGRLGSPRRFISYVQLHQFEGLLLSDGAVVAEYFQAPKLARLIDAEASRAGSPEKVNDGQATAPSKRLESWTHEHCPTIRRYTKSTKTRHGPQLASKLTLPVIRRACPRFDTWLRRLESIAT